MSSTPQLAPIDLACGSCGAANAVGKKFCGDCGAPLTSQLTPDLRAEVRSFLREQSADRKLVEVEITQAVAARLTEWAKLLGFFVGLPLAALGLVLASLGIRSYVDFTSKIEKASTEVDGSLRKAQERASEMNRQADKLSADYNELSTRLSDTKQLAAKYQDLASTVQQIGKKVGIDFQPSPTLDAPRRASLQSTLDGFQTYLERLGFRKQQGRIGISIQTATQNAWYDPAKNRLVLGNTVVDDHDAILHVYLAHVLDVGFPHVNGADLADYGFLDYLVCSYTNDPLLGERMAQRLGKPYLRNLVNKRPIDNLPFNGEIDRAESWGGLFWDIRNQLGQAAADRLVFSTRLSLAAGKPFNADEFARALIAGSGNAADAVRRLCEARGLHP